jgi:hypothetical protein
MNRLKMDNVKLKNHSVITNAETSSNIYYPLTQIQNSALHFYDQGFNVMPIPRIGMEHGGKKPPYGKFSPLFYTRLGKSNIPFLFERSNIAVICGRLSMNLFVLDCDNPKTYKWVGHKLNQKGLDSWVVESNRGGHYCLLSQDGEVCNSDPEKQVQILGNRKNVVAPPSVHPSGLIYQWKKKVGNRPPEINIENLSFLNGLSLVKSKPGSLPTAAQKVLIEKDIEDYPSNSEAELSAAMSLFKYVIGCQ